MKKFVLLYRGGNASADQQEQSMKDWGTYIADLTQKGVQKAGLPLAGGKIVTEESVSDYQSSDMDVSGYSEIEVESMDEAVKVAQMAPNVKMGGTVEVREDMGMPEM